MARCAGCADARRELAQGKADIAAQEELLGPDRGAELPAGRPQPPRPLDGAHLPGPGRADRPAQLRPERDGQGGTDPRTPRRHPGPADREGGGGRGRQGGGGTAASCGRGEPQRKKALEAQAEEAQREVAALVAARATAQNAAASARRADLDVLRGLQQERDRISDILAARAEAARRRAERAKPRRRRSPPPTPPLRAAAAESARAGRGFLDCPVDGYITSLYGMRLHPVYKRLGAPRRHRLRRRPAARRSGPPRTAASSTSTTTPATATG